MFYADPELDEILEKHRVEAENLITSSGSKRLGEIFQAVWGGLSNNTIDVSSSASNIITINPDMITIKITSWIKEVESLKFRRQTEFNRIENPTNQDSLDLQRLITHIDGRVIVTFKVLEKRTYELYEEFENTALAYRSPLHQVVNDMRQIYNKKNDIEGDFTGFTNVSVYIHGIEDTGEDFLDSAKVAATAGDIIVYEDRNGNVEYYVASIKDDTEKELVIVRIESEKILQTAEYKSKTGRLHMVYETEYKNEHRQKTSDDLAGRLIEMGLLNDETKIDMFAHSYGGRRSMQFAMDYPEYVRSITTIGTPYDKNMLGTLANIAPGIAQFTADKNVTEFSYYLDFNSKNQRTDDGIIHSNVYTDMSSEVMLEDIDQLKIANPEAYKTFGAISMIAVAGRATNEYLYRHYETGKTEKIIAPKSHDGTVSVKSQHGNSLEELIDDRQSFEVEGESLKKPSHSFEIESEDYIELIKQVNEKHKE